MLGAGDTIGNKNAQKLTVVKGSKLVCISTPLVQCKMFCERGKYGHSGSREDQVCYSDWAVLWGTSRNSLDQSV